MKLTCRILFLIFFGLTKLSAAENYPAGARSVALSNASVSLTDTWSTFHNQSTLALLGDFSAGVFYESRFMVDELSLAAATAVLPIRSGTFGLSFYQFGKETYKTNKVGLAFAKRLTQNLSAAVQFDYFSQRFPENDGANGFATFECGVHYRVNNELVLGAHVFNPVRNGTATTRGKQKMPAIFRIGGHYRFSDPVVLSFETQKNSGKPAVVKTGLEFWPVRNLALRFGLSGRPVQYTAGIGYRFGKVATDFAFSYHGNLGITPSVSIQFDL